MASVSRRFQARTINIYNRATTVFQKLQLQPHASSECKPPTPPLSNSGSLSATHSRVYCFRRCYLSRLYQRHLLLCSSKYWSIFPTSATDLAYFIRISPGICLSTRLWLPFDVDEAMIPFKRCIHIFLWTNIFGAPTLCQASCFVLVIEKLTERKSIKWELGTGSQEWHFDITAWL